MNQQKENANTKSKESLNSESKENLSDASLLNIQNMNSLTKRLIIKAKTVNVTISDTVVKSLFAFVKAFDKKLKIQNAVSTTEFQDSKNNYIVNNNIISILSLS